MTKIFSLITFGALICLQLSVAQVLRPGFDKEEYIETLKINHRVHFDVGTWEEKDLTPAPRQFDFAYRSPVVAFDNLWDLWIRKDRQVAMIAIRGSIQTEASFLANLYAAMIPAAGELELGKDFTFRYRLSDHPNAAVHAGWFVAMAYLSGTITQKIDSCYRAGIKDFIITGHSQGGGIAFLLNSHLESLKSDKLLPADIRFKTYCSAGPKPGNLFYAYSYEKMTAGGWAYNVVNTADWVPDVPFSVQTVNDFTQVNPFKGAKAMIRKQKFPANVALKHMYNKMSKPSLKAQKNYQKYLGKLVSKVVRKQIPDFRTPEYYNSNYYVRTGSIIPLYADDAYYELYRFDPEKPDVWLHHFPKPYLFLAEKLTIGNSGD